MWHPRHPSSTRLPSTGHWWWNERARECVSVCDRWRYTLTGHWRAHSRTDDTTVEVTGHLRSMHASSTAQRLTIPVQVTAAAADADADAADGASMGMTLSAAAVTAHVGDTTELFVDGVFDNGCLGASQLSPSGITAVFFSDNSCDCLLACLFPRGLTIAAFVVLPPPQPRDSFVTAPRIVEQPRESFVIAPRSVQVSSVAAPPPDVRAAPGRAAAESCWTFFGRLARRCSGILRCWLECQAARDAAATLPPAVSLRGGLFACVCDRARSLNGCQPSSILSDPLSPA